MTTKISIRKPYDPTVKTSKSFKSPSLTKRSFKAECDINTVMRKYQLTGVLEHTNTFQGQYGEFADIEDYQTSLNKVMDAQDMFMSLPSSIRRRFDNDPGEFLAFTTDEKNHDELVELGLIPKPAPKEPAEPSGDKKDKKPEASSKSSPASSEASPEAS